MKDAFYEFEWSVAPSYEWQPWLDTMGQAVAPSARLLRQLEQDVTECGSRFGAKGPAPSPPSAEIARGYARIEQQRAALALVSGPILTRVGAARSQPYRPMERQHAALFRRFAELDHRDTSAILAFASKYGDLGLVHKHQTVPKRDPSSGHLTGWHSANGESHLAWAIEICHMQEALRLAAMTSFDALRRLKWLSDRHLPDVRAELNFDKARMPRVAVRPLTLISALWLQFALAITGDKEFVECKFCKGLLEISTEQTGFRSHREFCSDSCKTKDYRKRKRTAFRLAETGGSVRDIAEKTRTNSATVRGWLAAAQNRKNSELGDA